MLKTVTEEYLVRNIGSLDLCIAVDLTLKQCVEGEWLDDIKAQRNFRYFMSFLNRKCFGNAWRRFNRRVEVVPILERKNRRYHYHTVFKVPDGKDKQEFLGAVIECWRKTRFGYISHYAHHVIDRGWVGYITKFRSSEDQVDWNNLHLDF